MHFSIVKLQQEVTRYVLINYRITFINASVKSFFTYAHTIINSNLEM